jgi:hypothetical protein
VHAAGDEEPAVYREFDGTWHFADGTTLDHEVPADDKGFPVPADYDGDGIDEPVLYHVEEATFLWPDYEPIVAANGTVEVHWPATMATSIESTIRMHFLQECEAFPGSCG